MATDLEKLRLDVALHGCKFQTTTVVIQRAWPACYSEHASATKFGHGAVHCPLQAAPIAVDPLLHAEWPLAVIFARSRGASIASPGSAASRSFPLRIFPPTSRSTAAMSRARIGRAFPERAACTAARSASSAWARSAAKSPSAPPLSK